MFQTLIASSTVGTGGAANITFSSIPQTYTDLTLVINIRSGSNNDTLFMRINGDTSATVSRIIEGNGASVSSSNSTTNTFVRFGTITSAASASSFSSGQAFFPNYTGSALKTVTTDYVSENAATTAYQTMVAGRFPLTAAITSLLISNTGSSLAEFSTAYLYGTLKGSGGATAA